MPASTNPGATRPGAIDSGRVTALVLQGLIDALRNPGAVNPGHAAHVVDELTLLLSEHRAAGSSAARGLAAGESPDDEPRAAS